MEHFYYSHTARIRQMREGNASEGDLRACRRSFTQELSAHREKAIKEMLLLYPKFYEPVIHYDDWKSGMQYLNEHKEFMVKILTQEPND